MSRTFISEQIIQPDGTPFAKYQQSDWALYFITMYGGIDGSHHKDWVLDQLARILNGTQPIIKLAKWSDGHTEYRVSLGDPSQQYTDWVDGITEGGQYDYEVGIPP